MPPKSKNIGSKALDLVSGWLAAGKSWAATGDPEEGLVSTQSARPSAAQKSAWWGPERVLGGQDVSWARDRH